MLENSNSKRPFCHIVIPAPDLEKAKSFYETVFGWRVDANVPGQNYWFFESGNIGGAFSSNHKPAARSITLMITVEKMEETLDLIRNNGGVVTRDRSAIGDAASGFDAYFLDPNENEMGIYSER
jgi:uncharacterized protein